MARGGYHPARRWYWRLLQAVGLVVHIWGSGRDSCTLYLRRWNLTPRRLPYQLLLHTFYRGDEDPDPHDHPWDFWTLPLGRRGYYEEVMDNRGRIAVGWVPPRRWTHRRRSHRHRVLGPDYTYTSSLQKVGQADKFPFSTLIIRRQPSRQDGPWGFWVRLDDPVTQLCGRHLGTNPRQGDRVKVPWRTYVLGEPQTEELTS